MKIKEIIDKNTLSIKNKEEREKIKALSLYSILQLPYFKGVYDTINVVKTNLEDIPYLLVTDNMNDFYGFTNKICDGMPIPLIKEDEYEAQFVSSSDYEAIYINEDKYKAIESLKKILIKSNNIDQFLQNIEIEQDLNTNFLHYCYNLNGRGKYNNFKKIFKIIESTLQKGTIKSEKLKSKIYTQEPIKKGFFSSISKNYNEEKIYEEVLNDYILSRLCKENNPLEYIIENNLFNDIFKEEKVTKKVIKNYISENEDSALSILLTESNQEKRIKKIVNLNWKKVKESFKVVLENDLSKFKLINKEIDKYKSEILNIKDNINIESFNNEPNVKDIKFYIVDTEYNESKFYPDEQVLLEKSKYKSEYQNYASENLNMINYTNSNNIKDYFYENPLNLFMYDAYNSNFDGLAFVNEDLFTKEGKNTYIIAKNKNETIGFLSVYDNGRNKHVKGIGNISVKYNHRGLGIPKMLYENLAKIAIDKNWIIANSMYTESGKQSLPEIKEEVREKYPDFMMIDTNYKIKKNEHCNEVAETFNSNVIHYIQSLSDNEFNSKKIKKAYNSTMNKILKLTKAEVEGYVFDYEKNQKLFSLFKKEINKEKNKKALT